LKRIPLDTWQQIKTAHASGIGLREIARNMGIPSGTILSRAKREGWTLQIQSVKALAKRDDSAPAVTPVEAVALSMQQRGERHVERMAGVSERGVDHIETMDGSEILNSVDRIEKLDKVARRTLGLKDHNPYVGFSLNVLSLGALQIEGDPANDLDWRVCGRGLRRARMRTPRVQAIICNQPMQSPARAFSANHASRYSLT
jgi:hypothetical protein